MAPPRGVKKLLRMSAPVTLRGRGVTRGFTHNSTNRKLSGLTKRLHAKIFSSGTFPSIALHGNGAKRVGFGGGAAGGRRRGSAVDSQLTKAINAGRVKPQPRDYVLTKLVLLALQSEGLHPVCAQRGVCDGSGTVATAVDFICYKSDTNQLAVVELKCGFLGARNAPALNNGARCTLRSPLSTAYDTHDNRHLAQLAATHAMLAREQKTLAALRVLGVSDDLEAMLLYVNDDRVDFLKLDEWWKDRAHAMLKALR